MSEIKIPALPRIPASEICAKYGFKSVVDNSPESEATMNVDCPFEDAMYGWDVIAAHRQTVPAQLGLSQALWFELADEPVPGFIYLTFPATVAVDSFGRRLIPCLLRYGPNWRLSWDVPR